MTIETLEGIEIFVLSNNAMCCASDGCVSPTKLDLCPRGREVCCPEGCMNYMEVDFEDENHRIN